MSASATPVLTPDAIFLGRSEGSMADVIDFVGGELVRRGIVQPAYIAAMKAREETVSTYLGNGVALPHGTFESKDEINGTAIVVAQYPNGIQWGGETAHLVIGLATQVRRHAAQDGTHPVWAPPGGHPPAALLGEVAVWRAAVGMDPRDRRPTGAGQLQTAAALWQQRLDRRISHPGDDPANRDLRRDQVAPRTTKNYNRDDRHHPGRSKVHPTSLPPRPR